MRIACTLFLSLLLTGVAAGQDSAVVPDTLDWHRYYPLEIGNTWEYGGLDAHVRMIVGDTLANGRRYFIRRDSVPAVGTLGPFINTFYLRYDTAGTVVTLPDLDADTVAAPLPFDRFRVDFPDLLGHFDMRSAFGDTLYFRAPDTLFYVQGGYDQQIQVGNEVVEVAALKCFGAEGILLWSGCYAADVGFVRGGNLFGSELMYAEVNGVVYGSPIFTAVETKTEVPEQFGIASIYPNPFSDKAAITYRLLEPSAVTVEVFDALGRRIWWDRTPKRAAGSGRLDLVRQGWPAGTYLVRLITERGAQSVRTVVVAE
ncbi:T9SS type A sorting domain-containing protein [Rhodocaloribacter sp.]